MSNKIHFFSENSGHYHAHILSLDSIEGQKHFIKYNDEAELTMSSQQDLERSSLFFYIKKPTLTGPRNNPRRE